jgi:hypothetical protein
MKKIIHYIEPRQSGKSTFARELLLLKPETSILYAYSDSGLPWRMIDQRGHKYDTIIIDEYIAKYIQSYQSERDKIEKFIRDLFNHSLSEDGELILISTPQKSYSKEQLFLASLISYPQNIGESYLYNVKEILETIKEIKGSFLEEDEVDIRRNTLTCRIKDKSSFRDMIGDKRFDLEFKANFIKTDI